MSSSSSSSSNNVPKKKETSIVEGSVTMKFPADQEEAVFYNPVQVQNRDISILMICLHAERRQKRAMVKQHKKYLRLEHPTKKESEIGAEAAIYEETLTDEKLSRQAFQEKHKHGLTILEALAASGLRSVRYWNEIPSVKHITINDMDPDATQRARANVEVNDLAKFLVNDDDDDEEPPPHDDKPYGMRIRHGDATHEMYLSRKPPHMYTPKPHQLVQQTQYDVIDLDPYGSAAPFLDGAVQAVVNGGMLCVTCTDMAALGGAHPETAYGRYGALPLANAKYLQEMALRILLHTLAITAAKYGRTIKPILSVGMNFYVRVFVEVYNDKAGVNALSLTIGQVYQSTRCPSFHTVPHGRLPAEGGKKTYQSNRAPAVPQCEESGGPFKVGGPIWLGPLHDDQVVATALQRVQKKKPTSNDTTTTTGGESKTTTTLFPNLDYIATRERIEGLLSSAGEELNDVPLFYTLPDLCHTMRCGSPPLAVFKAAIVNAGYRVSGYHKVPQAIKTDAPNRIVWDIMRAWCKTNPPKQNSTNSKKKKDKNKDHFLFGEQILAVEPSIAVDFTVPKDFGKKTGASRFPLNPEKNWGPKPASGIFSKKRKAATNSEQSSEGQEAKQKTTEVPTQNH